MSFIHRAKNIIITPNTEWAVIAKEEPNTNDTSIYVLTWTVVIAAVVFIGNTFIWHGSFNETEALILGVYFGIQTVFVGALGVWLSAKAINALAKNFGSEKDTTRAMQLVVYSMTPALALAGCFPDLLLIIFPVRGLIITFPPFGIIVLLFEFYGLYLLYLGLPKMMKTPNDKIMMYMVISTILLLFICILLGFIYRVILWEMIDPTRIQINQHPLK